MYERTLPKLSSFWVPRLAQLALCIAGILCLAVACDDDPKANAEDTAAADTAAPDGDTSAPDTQANPDGTDAADVIPPTAEQQMVLDVPEESVWEIPGLGSDVHVVYTEMGVPNIYATSRNDLGYAMGFLLARNRYFVMDLQRRLGQGTISKLLGDAGLESDMDARLLGVAEVTQRLLDHLDPDDAAFLDAYAVGVNAYIGEVRARRLPAPSELNTFKLFFGVDSAADLMEPFTRDDVAAMVAVIMYETTFEGGDVGRTAKAAALDGLFVGATDEDLRRAGARQDVWDHLAAPFSYASAPGWSATDNGGGAGGAPAPRRALHPMTLPPSLAARSADRLERLKSRFGRQDVENFGSNTWAVQSTKTKNGEALVAGDGHLQLSVPTLMFQIGLDTTVFGGGDMHQNGLLMTSLPLLGVGTNGHIAWSQVNPVADTTDWYREEVQLGTDGLPAQTTFLGEWKALERIDETYDVAEVAFLGSVGRQENWPRWVTFDGRHLYDIEGDEIAAADVQPGDAVVNFGNHLVIPRDVDGDGKVTGITFDYTAFDATKYIRTFAAFGEAHDVYEYQEATKGLIGNLLFSTAADQQGNIIFTSYQAVPCRGYLPKAGGDWIDGADPAMLLDGTIYGAFSIPSGPDGKVDEGPGATDPYQCAVPFDESPQVINPTDGYVVNANNQPAPITDDNSLANDPWYIGGPWSSVRADTISQGIAAAIAAGGADVESMAAVQGTTRSRIGELFLDHLLEAISAAKRLSMAGGLITADEQRLVDLYVANQARFDEVATRLSAWRDAGYATDSGVATFYHTLAANDLEDAVATMIFNAWLPRVLQGTYNDENMGVAFRFGRFDWRALLRFLDGRGASNPSGLASWNPATEESVFFDDLATAEVESSREIILLGLAGALDFLSSDPTGPGEGGFGTADMTQWLWGLRHQTRFESLIAEFVGSDSGLGDMLDVFSNTTATLPLAENMPAGDPRAELKWFPRQGDNYGVDAASPGFSGTRFTHGAGPVMRMVIALKDGRVWGQNILPGGQSGINSSPHYADQLKLWLANETIPVRFHLEDVIEGAVSRERLTPAP